MTTGNHWRRFLLWFLFPSYGKHLILHFTCDPCLSFPPLSHSSFHSPLFMNATQGQRPKVRVVQEESWLLFVCILQVCSHTRKHLRSRTRTDRDKGSPKRPWFPSFYSLQHIPWQSLSLHGWHILRNLPYMDMTPLLCQSSLLSTQLSKTEGWDFDTLLLKGHWVMLGSIK